MASASTPQRTVLFVDDEPAISDGLRRIMRSVADRWKVLTATGGDEALALLANGSIDVVVSDLRMPGMTGLALLERVRELYPAVARIVLSGSASSPSETEAAARVAHLRLNKPCGRDELIRALDEVKAG